MYIVCWRNLHGSQTWERIESEAILEVRVERLRDAGYDVWVFNERDALNLEDI